MQGLWTAEEGLVWPGSWRDKGKMESEGECTDGEMYAEYASTAARDRAHSERFAEGLSVQHFIVLFLPV